MGILDNIKNRVSPRTGASRDTYDDEDYAERTYDSDVDGYDPDGYDRGTYDQGTYGAQTQAYGYGDNLNGSDSDYQRQQYSGSNNQTAHDYDPDALDYLPEQAGGVRPFGTRRSDYVIDEHAPLISMTDVRSQELPPLTTSHNAANATSLDSRTPTRGQGYAPHGVTLSQPLESERIYSLQDVDDPLLRRHSLSNTGDFNATSPAYYASRSGVGHVRAAGEYRKPQRFRETVVVRPQSYEDAEQIAHNLKNGNVVCVVLEQTDSELARRILDFAFGATAALSGQASRPANRVYVFTSEYALTPKELELLQARGVL
ncbi:MAG: cell division protein SepF [Coriobacteriales bacterium]|jgi:hypothetical protein|nr:cell division protein SepF [Coriobacteriales bacterium]